MSKCGETPLSSPTSPAYSFSFPRILCAATDIAKDLAESLPIVTCGVPAACLAYVVARQDTHTYTHTYIPTSTAILSPLVCGS